MSLPPLSNLFAFHDPDPASLADARGRVIRSGRFVDIVTPRADWMLAVAPLPGDRDARYESGLAFAEGADLFRDDTALRAAAVREPHNLDRLPGDFTFLLFEDDLIRAVRSAGGLAPVYLFQQGERVAVSTRLTDLAAFSPTELELDPLVHATWMTGFSVAPDNRTFFRNVSLLPRGGFATLKRGGWELATYWDPRPARIAKPTPALAREHVERFRTVVVETLERQLSRRSNLLTLSGGVDSSTVGAIAAGVLDRPLATLSFLPTEGPDRDRSVRFLDNMERAFSIDKSWRLTMLAADRLEYLRAAPDVAFHITHPALALLPRLYGEHRFEVLVGGEFADMVAGSNFTLPDWARHTSLPALLRHPRSWPTGWKDPGRWVRFRFRRLMGHPLLPFPQKLGPMIVNHLQGEYQEWRRRQVKAVAADRRALIELSLRTRMDGFLAMNWEITSEIDVRRSLPFFNRAMLELAFECHPDELVGPGTKKILRQAFRGDVPEENLFRSDRGHWRPPPEPPLPPPAPELLPPSIVASDRPDMASLAPVEQFFLWTLARFVESTSNVRSRNFLDDG